MNPNLYIYIIIFYIWREKVISLIHFIYMQYTYLRAGNVRRVQKNKFRMNIFDTKKKLSKIWHP